MSKKRSARSRSAKAGAKSSAKLNRRPRRRAFVGLVLMLASIAATSIVAAQGGLGALVSAPSALRKLASGKTSGNRTTSGGASGATSKSAAALQSPTPPPLTKEYIYAGGKLIATEEPISSTAPIINSVQPDFGAQGQGQGSPPVRVLVTGDRLAGAQISFDGTGVTATIEQSPAPTDSAF